MRKWCGLAGVLVMGMLLSGCYTVTEIKGNFDPGKRPYMSSQFTPGWGGTSPTVCMDRASRVSGRADQCRVMRGFEDGPGGWGIDDERNWMVDFPNDPFKWGPDYWFLWGNQQGKSPAAGCPVLTTILDVIDPFGCTIVLADGPNKGWVFEGCEFDFGTNIYICDFRARFDRVMTPEGATFSNFYLKAMINWGAYVVDAIGCAANIRFWAVTNESLDDCADGPYTGPIAGAEAGDPDDRPTGGDPGQMVDTNVVVEQSIVGDAVVIHNP